MIIKQFIKYQKVILILIFLLAFFQEMKSQTIPYSEEITIIAPYKPTISNAYKLTISPRIATSQMDKPEFNFTIQPTPFKTNIQPKNIKPVSIIGEPLSKLHRNFIKAGFGNYRTPYIEFFAHSLRSKKRSLGVHLKHLSSGDLKDYPNSGQSDSEIDITSTKYLKNHDVHGDIIFKRNVVHHYGIDESFPENYDITKEFLKQRYITTGADFGLNSRYLQSSKLNHSLNFNYNYLFDLFKSSEHNVNIKADMNHDVKIFRVMKSQNLGLETQLDLYRNKDTLSTHTGSVLTFKPYFSTSFNEYSFFVGIKTSIKLDTISKAYFYPLAEVKLSIIPEIFKAWLGFSGELYKNSFRSFSTENPFIISIIPLEYTNNTFKLYGGLSSRIGRFIDFKLSLDGSTINNLPLFVNDTSTQQNRDLYNQFTVVYDDAKLFHAKAEIIFQDAGKYLFILGADLFKYDVEAELEAWHKPLYDISFIGQYNIQDKFIMDGGFIIVGKSYARTFQEGKVIPKQLDGFIDINLALEYKYSKQLSGFINLNNIANVEYFRWNNYASQRFNFLIGVMYSF
ncbi:MAG: TonB-dependent receptor [Bacteroidales bacterium]|nr:TonB-dependent receptor [Bacteroidales bacterium]